MFGTTLPLLLALTAQTSAPPPAPSAAPGDSAPARVVVVATGRTPALDAVAAEAEVLARQRVQERGGFVVVNATAPGRVPSGVEREARALLDEGEAAYAELDTRRAVTNLEKAVTLLRGELDRDGDRALLVRALALLGSVHNQSGNRAQAERAFSLLLALSPTHSLDDGTFPPSDVKLLERLQEELAFTAPGTLEVTSGDVPAAVWLDGRLRGFTPLSLENVEPGTHLYLVRRGGYVPSRGTVVVGEEPAQVRAKLAAPASDGALPDRVRRLVVDSRNLHPTLLALIDGLADPEELLAVVVEEDAESGPTLKVVRVLASDAVLVGYREVPLGDGWRERFTAAVDDLLAAPTKPEIPAPAVAEVRQDDPPAAEGDTAVWWIAGAAGGLALGAVIAGGAALAVLGQGSDQAKADDAHALARRRVVLGF